MSGAILELAGSVAGEALKAFLRTVLGLLVLAFVLSVAAFAVAFDGVWWRGLLAILLTVVDVGVIGGILAAKRSLLGALSGGLQRQHLGQRAAALVFSPDGPLGKAAERVPLAEAERRLRSAVEAVLGQRAQQTGVRAWFARGIQARLLEGIEQVTLARFRADAAEHGGAVDLARIGAELGDRADQLLLDKVRGAATKLAAMLVLAASAIALLVALALRQIPT